MTLISPTAFKTSYDQFITTTYKYSIETYRAEILADPTNRYFRLSIFSIHKGHKKLAGAEVVDATCFFCHDE